MSCRGGRTGVSRAIRIDAGDGAVDRDQRPDGRAVHVPPHGSHPSASRVRAWLARSAPSQTVSALSQHGHPPRQSCEANIPNSPTMRDYSQEWARTGPEPNPPQPATRRVTTSTHKQPDEGMRYNTPYVGVIRSCRKQAHSRSIAQVRKSVPRTGGDGPRSPFGVLDMVGCSPHRRGWSHRQPARRDRRHVFPAPAGMVPHT